MQTHDRQWRVEVVRRGDDTFFRLIHHDNVVDGLAIDALEELLAEAGVDMGDLAEAPSDQRGVA